MNFPDDPGFKYFDDNEKTLINEVEAAAEAMRPYSADEQKAIIERFRSAAAKERKSVTVRLEKQDLEKFRVIAEQEGMPYQTLLGSLVHKYVNGVLVDLNEARKILAIS